MAGLCAAACALLPPSLGMGGGLWGLLLLSKPPPPRLWPSLGTNGCLACLLASPAGRLWIGEASCIDAAELLAADNGSYNVPGRSLLAAAVRWLRAGAGLLSSAFCSLACPADKLACPDALTGSKVRALLAAALLLREAD